MESPAWDPALHLLCAFGLVPVPSDLCHLLAQGGLKMGGRGLMRPPPGWLWGSGRPLLGGAQSWHLVTSELWAPVSAPQGQGGRSEGQGFIPPKEGLGIIASCIPRT